MLVTVQPTRTTNPPPGLASKAQTSAQQLIQQQCGHQPLPLGVFQDSFWNEGGLKLDLLMCSSLQILVH